jgi:transcriptional regulator with XRE-family HTH domain
MEINYIALGKRIAKRRNVLDITQAELAERADLSATYTGNVERGAKCSLETLMKICTALEVTPDYLLLGIDKGYRNDSLDEMKDLLYRCETKKQKTIRAFIEWFADQEI